MALFTYDTYQDVRQNLFRYSIPFLIVAGFFCYLRILPAAHQRVVITLIEYVSNSQPWKELLGTGAGVVAFTCIAFLLTEVFQVHDQWYDKYIIKWRRRYDTDYILPRLVQPFSSSLNYRFFEEAERHTEEFQKELFYPFVGDRDLKIAKNKLVRFYEVVTLYWLTQINEIVLVVMSILVGVYRFVGPDDLVYRTSLLTNCIILGLAFLVNRFAVRRSLNKVRTATADEIYAIHEDPDLLANLKARLFKLCADYKIPIHGLP